jgi:hypothetical protein
MSVNNQSIKTNDTVPRGGVIFAGWLLGEEVRTINTKSGEEKCVVSLRDPRRLSNALVVWLDGPAGDVLSAVEPGTAISLHVPAVRAGKARGELVADTDRGAVEAAFVRAGAGS